jgi:hypothetical protein
MPETEAVKKKKPPLTLQPRRARCRFWVIRYRDFAALALPNVRYAPENNLIISSQPNDLMRSLGDMRRLLLRRHVSPEDAPPKRDR